MHTLLLAEVNGVLLGVELERGALHVVSRGGPAHQWVLPAARALENVPVDPPGGSAGLPGSGSCLVWAENAHRPLGQLRWGIADDLCGVSHLDTGSLLLRQVARARLARHGQVGNALPAFSDVGGPSARADAAHRSSSQRCPQCRGQEHDGGIVW